MDDKLVTDFTNILKRTWLTPSFDVQLSVDILTKYLDELEETLSKVNAMIDENEEEAKKALENINKMPLFVYLEILKKSVDRAKEIINFHHKDSSYESKYKRIEELIDNMQEKTIKWNTDKKFDKNKTLLPEIRFFEFGTKYQIENKEINGVEYPMLVTSYQSSHLEKSEVVVDEKKWVVEDFLYQEDKIASREAEKDLTKKENEIMMEKIEDTIKEFFTNGIIPQQESSYHQALIPEIKDANIYREDSQVEEKEKLYHWIRIEIFKILEYYWNEKAYPNQRNLSKEESLKNALENIEQYKKQIEELEKNKEQEPKIQQQTEKGPSRFGSFLSRLRRKREEAPKTQEKEAVSETKVKEVTAKEKFENSRGDALAKLQKQIEEQQRKLEELQQEIENIARRKNG